MKVYYKNGNKDGFVEIDEYYVDDKGVVRQKKPVLQPGEIEISESEYTDIQNARIKRFAKSRKGDFVKQK